jgi:hypothetical protein
MRDSSRGTTVGDASSEDLAAPVALRGAMALLAGADFSRRRIGRVDWMCKLFGRGVAAAMCYEGEGGAFSAKL